MGLLLCLIQKLLLAQNAAAWFLMGVRPCQHKTARNKSEICVGCQSAPGPNSRNYYYYYKVLKIGTSLLAGSIYPTFMPSRPLQSADLTLLQVPNNAHSALVRKQSFSLAVPTLWNSLSLDTRPLPSLPLPRRVMLMCIFTCNFSLESILLTLDFIHFVCMFFINLILMLIIM